MSMNILWCSECFRTYFEEWSVHYISRFIICWFLWKLLQNALLLRLADLLKLSCAQAVPGDLRSWSHIVFHLHLHLKQVNIFALLPDRHKTPFHTFKHHKQNLLLPDYSERSGLPADWLFMSFKPSDNKHNINLASVYYIAIVVTFIRTNILPWYAHNAHGKTYVIFMCWWSSFIIWASLYFILFQALGTYPCFLISETEAINSNIDGYSLFVLASCSDRHLEICKGFLAHPVPPSLAYFENSNQLCLEAHPYSQETWGFILVCNVKQ